MRKPVSLIICFLIPAIVVMVGFSFAGMYGYRAIPELFVESARGMVPKGFVAHLDKPGKYTVWLQVRGREAGRFYSGAETLPPGSKIYLFDHATGKEIALTSWVASSKNMGEERAVSLGTFLVDRPEQKVEVKGTGLRKPVLISVAPTNMNRTIRVVLSILGIIVVTLTVAIFLFIIMLHRRQKMLEDASQQ